MLTEEQKRELKEILSNIYISYGIERGTLFYKKKHRKRLGMVRLSGIILDSNKLIAIINKMREIIFDPQLEYAVFIAASARGLSLSEICLNEKEWDSYLDDLYLILYQLIPGGVVGTTYQPYKFVEDMTGIETLENTDDPLSQIFTYYKVYSTHWPQHVYFCPEVHIYYSYDPDVSSILHGKDGIVAYCMSLHDLILTNLYSPIKWFQELFREVFVEFDNKINKNERKLRKLFYKDRIKACDIDFVKSLAKEEIEKAESIMKQYGIERIIIPLY